MKTDRVEEMLRASVAEAFETFRYLQDQRDASEVEAPAVVVAAWRNYTAQSDVLGNYLASREVQKREFLHDANVYRRFGLGT